MSAAFDEAFDFLAFDLDVSGAAVSLADAPVTALVLSDAPVTVCTPADALVVTL